MIIRSVSRGLHARMIFRAGGISTVAVIIHIIHMIHMIHPKQDSRIHHPCSPTVLCMVLSVHLCGHGSDHTIVLSSVTRLSGLIDCRTQCSVVPSSSGRLRLAVAVNAEVPVAQFGRGRSGRSRPGPALGRKWHRRY